nr:MAG TPA: hypothetical protein [Caudoviricetes sp.]
MHSAYLSYTVAWSGQKAARKWALQVSLNQTFVYMITLASCHKKKVKRTKYRRKVIVF